MPDAKILIVQDDHSASAYLAECLIALGYIVCATVSHGQQAIEKAAEMHPDLVLIDLGLEGEVNGVDVGAQIGSQIPVVYLVDEVKEDLLQRAEATHPFGYVIEPVDERQLHLNIQTALSLNKKINELRNQNELMETAFNSISDGVAFSDLSERSLYINPSAAQMTGIDEMTAPVAEWPRKYGFFYPDQKTLMKVRELPFIRILFRGASIDDDVFIRNEKKPDGVYIRMSGGPLRNENDQIRGAVIIFRDVTEQMKAEVLRLRSELEMTSSFDGIVGNSPKMQQMYALIKQVAESDITVLIRGESGTGKELVARLFHFNSPRKEGPFLAINCAALPEALIESELFGHEKGAFTGATEQKIGAFERAQGGTILLDEIGDMLPIVQAKLLRVLQEREIQRVGGTTTIPIDVRIIAATNQNLEDAVLTGAFREDLFYRLSAFPIEIPSLRERRDDIPLLADYFLKKYAKSAGKSIGSLSTATLRVLRQYDWPGNVRELENAIEHAILLETTDVLQAHNLPDQLSSFASIQSAPPAPTANLSLEEAERQAIVRALEATENNIAEAARDLGMGRTTLYRKLKKYDLPSSD